MQSIIRSRDSWKQKAIARRHSVRSHEQKLRRLNQRHQLTLQRLQIAEKQNEFLRERLRIKALPLSCPSTMESTVTCVMLIIQARISFRAAPRALMAMGYRGWVPHFSSVINWVCRVGLSCLKHIKSPTEDWIAIIDMSIDIAYKKALVILRLPLSVYVERGGAVTLEDVSCAGVLVRESWKSEGVAEALQEILGNEPHLRGILKDNGSDLQKGVRLWKEVNQRPDVFVISDIGHEAANALKADFKDRESFKSLTRKLKIMQPRYTNRRLHSLLLPSFARKEDSWESHVLASGWKEFKSY